MSAVQHGKAESRKQKQMNDPRERRPGFAWFRGGRTGGIGLDERTSRRIVGSRVADYEHLTHKKTSPPGPETAGRGTVDATAESSDSFFYGNL
jgi:hypothetical protein